MSAKILITGETFLSNNVDILKQKGYDIEVRTKHLDEDALVDALTGKDVYILGGVETATAGAIKRTNGLKIIAVMGTGYQSFVDADAATQKGIVITNTPNTNSRAVAEMTIGFMLSMRRKISFINHLTKTGGWRDDIVSKNLHGQTLGIIGMGAIGSIVAEIAHNGLGMNIVYHSRSPKPVIEERVKAKKVTLEKLLSQSDFVSLHCPTTQETTHMVGELQFKMMKKTAILVNNARPQVVEPNALYTALKEGYIAGCAMDGYYSEPAPSPENDSYGLLNLPDEIFLVSSHLAYLTEDSIQKMCDLATTSVINVLEGKEDKHIVNPEYKNFQE